MSEFDNETADVSAVLDAYMYLDYQYKSKGKQEENLNEILEKIEDDYNCLLYTSPSPRDS